MQGADVNKADARGITALGLAVGYNKVPLVKVLIEGGADVSRTDAKGSTVLHYAAGNGSASSPVFAICLVFMGLLHTCLTAMLAMWATQQQSLCWVQVFSMNWHISKHVQFPAERFN